MDRPKQLCRECGIPTDNPYCPAHVRNNAKLTYSRERYKHDEVSRLYLQTPWKKFSGWLRRRNAQCQRLIDGNRCLNPSAVVHHLVSPRVDLTRFMDPSNVVCLCTSCHPAGRDGTPEWIPGRDYTPTQADLVL